MKLQGVSKLPNRKILYDVVRQGNNWDSTTRPPLSNDTVMLTFLEAYQYVWTMTGVAEYLRYQAWLQAYSVVPDGTACWISGSHNKSCISKMWGGWAQARHEYEERTKNSGGQKTHMKAVVLKMPSVPNRKAGSLWRDEIEWVVDLIVNRLDTHYGDKGQYLSASPIAEGEHTGAVTHIQQQKKRAVPMMQAKATLPDYLALRRRDTERTCNIRLRFSFDDEVLQARYEYIWHKYNVYGIERYAYPVAKSAAWNEGMYIAIRPARQGRHTELLSRLVDRLTLDKPAIELEIPSVEESATGWMSCLPHGEFIAEVIKKEEDRLLEDTKIPVVVPPAAKEPVMRPAEEQMQDGEQIKHDWVALGHNDHEYGLRLEEMSCDSYPNSADDMLIRLGCCTGYITADNMESVKKSELPIRIRRVKAAGYYTPQLIALKVGTMGIGDKEEKGLEIMGPPQPAKLQSQYSVTAPEAPVKSKRSTLDLLISYDDVLSEVSEHIEVDDFLKGIGGASTFVKSEASGLYLPPTLVDDDAPAWLDA